MKQVIIQWRGSTRIEGPLAEDGEYQFKENGDLVFYRSLSKGDYVSVFEYDSGVLLRRLDFRLTANLPATEPFSLKSLPDYRVTKFVSAASSTV